MFEEVMAFKTDVTHEDMTQRIVRDTEIGDILESGGFSRKEMSELSVGKLPKKDRGYMNDAIGGGLSVDIMDYLLRDSYFTGVEYGKVDVTRIINSFEVVRDRLAIGQCLGGRKRRLVLEGGRNDELRSRIDVDRQGFRGDRIVDPGLAAYRATGATIWMPMYLSYLALAHAEVRQFEEAWRCIGEAMGAVETTKESWCEAEVHRTAGEIALMAPEPDAATAEAYFQRALAIARVQKARSRELRAATSLARLWRDRDKRQQARDLLAPVYAWFTEGFHTLDLKEAQALLDALAS